MGEVSTAASHSLAKEAEELFDLIAAFEVGGPTAPATVSTQIAGIVLDGRVWGPNGGKCITDRARADGMSFRKRS